MWVITIKIIENETVSKIFAREFGNTQEDELDIMKLCTLQHTMSADKRKQTKV